MSNDPPCLDIVVVGGGLVCLYNISSLQMKIFGSFNSEILNQVGALVACFLAKRGHHIRVYEYREGKVFIPQ